MKNYGFCNVSDWVDYMVQKNQGFWSRFQAQFYYCVSVQVT